MGCPIVVCSGVSAVAWPASLLGGGDGGLVGEDFGAVAFVAVVRGHLHGEVIAVGGHFERVARGDVARGGELLERHVAEHAVDLEVRASGTYWQS